MHQHMIGAHWVFIAEWRNHSKLKNKEKKVSHHSCQLAGPQSQCVLAFLCAFPGLALLLKSYSDANSSMKFPSLPPAEMRTIFSILPGTQHRRLLTRGGRQQQLLMSGSQALRGSGKSLQQAWASVFLSIKWPSGDEESSLRYRELRECACTQQCPSSLQVALQQGTHQPHLSITKMSSRGLAQRTESMLADLNARGTIHVLYGWHARSPTQIFWAIFINI